MSANSIGPHARILVTGGAGFIGSSFVRLMAERYPLGAVLTLDKLTYAGNLENLAPVQDRPNYGFYRGDICNPEEVRGAFEAVEARWGGPADAVVHFAAETHVDRSILNPTPFLETNVLGTGVMLQAARERGVGRFVHVSTDEVYGSLAPGEPPFTEQSPLAANNPYSASKAASDLLARAYYETYGFPVIITRCSNNYGPYQFPEKLIPLMIANALQDKPLPVYGNGMQVRDWIYADDHSRGIDAVLRGGRPGEIYHLGARCELPNIDVVRTILRSLGKPESLIRYVQDRPGHDVRYAMDTSKIEAELGWRPGVDFVAGIEATIAWYLGHQDWVERVRSGAYLDYYAQQYGARLA